MRFVKVILHLEKTSDAGIGNSKQPKMLVQDEPECMTREIDRDRASCFRNPKKSIRKASLELLLPKTRL